MPKIYRLNASGQWTPLSRIYRLNSSGQWVPLKTVYRLNASGQWLPVFTSQATPAKTTDPVLQNQISRRDDFYSEDVLTLTRGAYTNTTANTNTTYRMTIYKSINSTVALSSWTVASRSTFNGSNSTATTSINYTITDQDAKDGYYFAAEVRVDNDASNPNSDKFDFETLLSGGGQQRVLSRMFFETSSFTATTTATGATLSWFTSGVPDSSFIYQNLSNSASIVRITVAAGGAFVVDVPAYYSNFSNGNATVPVGTLTPSTVYRADLILIGNDGWKTTNSQTKSNKGAVTSGVTFITFTTKDPAPINSVPPTISPLNSRGRPPVSTVLTLSQGTWTNVNAGTVYSYKFYLQEPTFTLPPQLVSSSNIYTAASDKSNHEIFGRVGAKNTNSNETLVTTQTYILDPAVTVTGVTPTTATLNVATNFTFTVSNYPTQYTVDWGDGTSTNSGALTAASVSPTLSKTYTSSGTKIVKVTAQPGNIQSTTNVIVSVPAPSASGFAKSDGTIIPSQPSTISFSSSNNIVTSSWTNGSPITSVNFAGSGAGVNTNYTDTTDPFMTSDMSNYSSSGTYTATVTNYNNSRQVNVSWNQSNAQSYTITYNSNIFGDDFVSANNSGSSVSVSIPWSSGMGTFSWKALTLYSGQNQTGTSTFYSNPSPGGVIPQQQSSERTNTTSLTYIAPSVQFTGSQRRTTLPSAFSSGTIIFITTNGYIGIGASSNPGTSGNYVVPNSGLYLMPLSEDLVQTELYTYTDVNNFYVRWRGYAYGAPAETVDYQVKFWYNSTSVDVHFVQNLLSAANAPSTTAVKNSGSEFRNWSSSTSQSSSLISLGSMTRNTSRDNFDDNYTQITASVPAAPFFPFFPPFFPFFPPFFPFFPPFFPFFPPYFPTFGSVLAAPTNVQVSGSGLVTWTHAGASTFNIEFFTAGNSTGSGAAGPYTQSTTVNGSYQLVSPYGGSGANWARARVRASNGGTNVSAYSAWFPSETTYV